MGLILSPEVRKVQPVVVTLMLAVDAACFDKVAAADKTAVEVAKKTRRVDWGDVDEEDDWGVLVWYDVDKSTHNTREASTKRRLENINLLCVDWEE